MKINRNIAAMLALTALAFAAGRAGWLGTAPEASAQPMQQELQEELSPDMLAAIEAGMPGEHHRHLDQLIGE